jgi:hypothetical protein
MTPTEIEIWRPGDGHDLEGLANSIQQEGGKNVYKPEFLDAVDASIDSLSDELRTLSLDIHGKDFYQN